MSKVTGGTTGTAGRSDGVGGPASQRLMTIGDLASTTGIAATALRYYEHRGLLLPVERQGGQRRYDSSSVARLMVITFCRFAGLSLDDIALIVNDESEGRAMTRELAARQVDEVDKQLVRLKLARQMMQAVSLCTCANPEACTCGAMTPVIKRLRSYLGR
jgi:MerR family transcriptional regulator, redox-sensitive transcriptional activator SoxR